MPGIDHCQMPILIEVGEETQAIERDEPDYRR